MNLLAGAPARDCTYAVTPVYLAVPLLLQGLYLPAGVTLSSCSIACFDLAKGELTGGPIRGQDRQQGLLVLTIQLLPLDPFGRFKTHSSTFS